MIRWLKRVAFSSPREAFPIDNLPIETYSETRTDALRLMYRQKKTPPAHDNVRAAGSGTELNKNKEDFFRRILPILDGFDNIFKYAHTSQTETNETVSNWLKTLETLYRRLLSALEKEGLVAVESEGRLLDLSIHEVIDARTAPDLPDRTILEEVVKGYRYGNRVLRDAKVIIAKNT
ncbi:MAG: nucleotide exchange factor GrpE [bacterium]|nr:nucleotide exchange factor GrpE [bacterium]